jgi:SAM-dependent methyltransferase
MTTHGLRGFLNRSYPVAAGLAALTAALDAKAGDVALEPALDARLRELLAALGAADVMEGLSPEEAAQFASEIRQLLRVQAKLLTPRTRATSWSYDDPQLLQEFGDFARYHAHALARMVVPALDGLAARFGGPDAAFLDVGVGVAGLAVELARLYPSLRVVGIDVFEPALRLARENVARAGVGDRVTLRAQGAEQLDDDRAFDLAWIPSLFMPEPILPAAVERTHRALRPGGWLVFVTTNVDGRDPLQAAFWRFTTTMFGGPCWSAAEGEALLRAHGFSDVRALPAPPGTPAAFVVGRRAAAA